MNTHGAHGNSAGAKPMGEGDKKAGADAVSSEMETLLDSNYMMIRELTRLRYTRPAGQPRAAERKLMRLVEENLTLLVAAQKPRVVASGRAALATRAMMLHVDPA
eukprot:CAMPEP_0180127706 /NCGR_PEP_ID=MMETSP0986-20121125/6366_1 /TAXON_ID=697907 /ORGANISM="non described non described, Strain CCMP2293" /LENGTH=104 /DNA_ID=CAMNT_0022067207 /DNA_START=10 /DNA_END=320 /DNA_ORIENTATION=-